jgi:hypothetical protein
VRAIFPVLLAPTWRSGTALLYFTGFAHDCHLRWTAQDHIPIPSALQSRIRVCYRSMYLPKRIRPTSWLKEVLSTLHNTFCNTKWRTLVEIRMLFNAANRTTKACVVSFKGFKGIS